MRNTKPKKKQIKIALQIISRKSFIPTRYYLQRWINKALINRTSLTNITLRIVNKKESIYLNETYRHKRGPTNILSFPFEPPPDVYSPLLGDLVICAELVNKEAKQQQKTRLAHWAHLIIHGCLHLIGYDHILSKEALKMETLEIQLLEELGYENPY
ncbi:MAG: rRNA maturation RNase YbeY [Rickettsiella sp.]|nr:rRNA maturation RNase YbeY [Rickettsiella sp.]